MSRGHRTPPPAPAASRRRLLGQVAAVAWYLGGFALLLAGAVTQTGPYAWAAAWQQRHGGSDTVLFSFLPGFLLLLAPLVVLNRLPHRPDRPFLLGMQEAIWPPAGATRRTVPVGTQAERLRRVSRGMAGVAVVSLLGGGFGCWWALRPGPQVPGSPLPELALSAVPDVPLPPYARITGAVPRADRAWVHDHSIRLTSYHDVFIPLTAPGWRDGDPVAVLELDIRADPTRAGPPEGVPERGRLPAWQVAAMREGGLRVTDDPVVLRRMALNGVVPAPDPVDAVALGVIGATLALVCAGIAWSCRLTLRRIGGPGFRG